MPFYSFFIQKRRTFAGMRRWLAYFIPLLLCACQGNSIRQELHRVDSLNQCDVLLDTITTMDEVVDYLDWWGTPNERMTAHYLRGRVFHDQNNAPMALRYYRDAVGYADTSSDDCDYRRLCRIYGQIAVLFHRQRAPRLEIEAEQKAVEYAWKAKDTLSAVTFYYYLGAPYHMLNNIDSVLLINKQSREWFEKIGHTDMASSTLMIDAEIYLRLNNPTKAKQSLDSYATGKKDRLYKTNLAHYYLQIGQLDSAEILYSQLLYSSNNDVRIENAYKGLLSVYSIQGKSDSIAKYSILYCQANDSANFKHSADEITRTQALYNYEEHERIAAMKTQEADRYRQAIFFLIVILSVAGYASYRYVKRQQRRKRAALVAANQEYHALLVQYQRLQQDMQLSQQSLDEFRDEKEREISQLIQQLSLYQDTPLLSEHWHIEQAMLDSSIISDLHHIACQAKVASNVQLKELREFVEAQLPDFFTAINNKEAMLTPQELSVSILIRLQFSQGELSALFGVSKQRINNIKRSINRKLFKSDGAVTLNDNILSLCQM